MLIEKKYLFGYLIIIKIEYYIFYTAISSNGEPVTCDTCDLQG